MQASPDRLMSNSSMRRTKIFENTSQMKSPLKEDDLVVINHTRQGAISTNFGLGIPIGETVNYANANER